LIISVYTMDKEDHYDIHTSGYLDKDEQKPWVKRLGFDYKPRDDDDWEITGRWEYGDHDDPCRADAKMNVTVYYKHHPCPPNEKFETIDPDGELLQWAFTVNYNSRKI